MEEPISVRGRLRYLWRQYTELLKKDDYYHPPYLQFEYFMHWIDTGEIKRFIPPDND